MEHASTQDQMSAEDIDPFEAERRFRRGDITLRELMRIWKCDAQSGRLRYAVYIVHRKGTPQEWHQLTDRRASALEAADCVRCALDMSGLELGYITRDGVPVEYYRQSIQDDSSRVVRRLSVVP